MFFSCPYLTLKHYCFSCIRLSVFSRIISTDTWVYFSFVFFRMTCFVSIAWFCPDIFWVSLSCQKLLIFFFRLYFRFCRLSLFRLFISLRAYVFYFLITLIFFVSNGIYTYWGILCAIHPCSKTAVIQLTQWNNGVSSDISLKVDLIAWLESELAFLLALVLHFKHCSIGNSS